MIRLAFSLLLLALATGAKAQCRQALALGLDVSGSVDTREYHMQINGLAAALDHPEVRTALLSMPNAPVRLLVYEWSAAEYQRHLLEWTEISDAAILDRVVAHLRATPRRKAPTGTALGAALAHGAAVLGLQPDCWRRTLDISGDGKNNVGPQPKIVRGWLVPGTLTVNALTIGADAPRSGDLRQAEIAELSSYFRSYVIFGPEAFVETALGFEDYEAAMVRKLIRELGGMALSGAPDALPDLRRTAPARIASRMHDGDQ